MQWNNLVTRGRNNGEINHNVRIDTIAERL